MKTVIAESLEAVHTHTHTHTHTSTSKENISNLLNKLFSNKIGSINCAKKYMNINKDRLYVKIIQTSLQNSLSFLCLKEVIGTKDKYA